jgi:hypothetical protein
LIYLIEEKRGMQPPPPPNRFPTPRPPRKPDLAQRFEALPERTKLFIIYGTIIGVILLAAAGSMIDSAIHPQLTPTATTQVNQVVADPTPIPELTQAPAQPTMDVQPTQSPPTPTPLPVYVGVNGNPWGYDFNLGNNITSPPPDFCNYFNCIKTFWNGTGYVEECQDQTFSLSGGNSGSCSRHGGDWRPLYSH